MCCLGCRLANEKEPVHILFEDEFVCCFLDHEPYNEGHTLVLPKKHVRYFEELNDATARSLIQAIKKISQIIKQLYEPAGITVCQNGGVFDELTHFHMHIIPRYEGQNFADFYSEEEESTFRQKMI